MATVKRKKAGSDSQLVRIADLLPKPEKIEVAPGNYIMVHHLNMAQIIKLFWMYKESLLSVYAQGQSETPNYSTLVLTAPQMVADIIAMGTRTEGQEKDLLNLPGTTQVEALSAIWRLSVPDPKKLKDSLSMVTGQLQSLSGLVENKPTTSKATKK